MATIVNDNKACCTLPPVQANYTPKGAYETVAGIKSYVTGNKDSDTAIISIMDIFGFAPQTVQGADLLSSSGAYVVMPDFLDGKPLSHTVFPPDTKEKQDTIQNFFKTTGSPPAGAEKTSRIIAELKEKGASKVFLVGYCWGAKVAMLSAAKDPVTGVMMCHPSLLQAEDADAVNVPVAMFPSKDEDAKLMAALKEKFEAKPFASKSVFKTYSDQPHGWSAARGDLESESGIAGYTDVYQRMVNWVGTF